jgi:hypothetical protein
VTAERGPEPTESRPSLRVGVLVDEPRIQRWQLECISEIARASFCDLVVLVPEARQQPRRTWSARHLLYAAYERLDRRGFGTDRDPLATVELPATMDGGDLTRVAIGRSPEGRWSAADIARISSEGFDVLVSLGDESGLEALAPCARHGAWSVANPDARADAAPLFWETFSGQELSVTTVWSVKPGDGERAIYQSHARIDPVSVHRNRVVSARRAASLPLRCLRRLHERDAAFTEPPPSTPPEPRPKPTNLQVARFLWRVARRLVGHRLRNLLFEEHWYLAYRRTERGAGTEAGDSPFITIAPPPDRFYADPFVLQRDQRHFLFFEEYLYATEQGRIAYVEIDAEGRPSAPRLALECDHHLSYPFLHQEGSSVYLVPESGFHRSTEMYRASRFPDRWELDTVLLDGIEALDPTLLHHQGKYWLFAGVADGPWADELCLFFSDSLHGEWKPHPMNPVVSDIRRARPAGSIFTRAGELIRPAQDGSEAYGGRIVLNRIERLDETHYRERPIGHIEPVGPRGSLRTHSYNTDGLVEVVDGFRFRAKIPLPGKDRRTPDPLEHFRIELNV